MRTTLRALLALSLLAGFYLLMLAVVVADVIVMVEMVVLPSQNQARVLGIPSNAVTTITFSAPMLAAIFYGVFTVSQPNAPLAGSVLLRRSQAPELWEIVEELADEIGTRPPTQIRLVGEVNAMVSEESYLLGLFAGPSRLLYIGAPLLVGLGTDELRAVLSHELGHYARRHTRLAAIVYRGSAALQATLERLFDAGGGNRRFTVGFAVYIYLLLNRYAKLYHRVAFGVNRRQELEADAAAARIVGPQVIAEALRAVHAIAVSWARFDGQILAPMRRSGRLPDDPFSAYQAMLEDPRYRDEFARLRYEIPQEVVKPLDSHPSLATRLHMLGGLPSEVVPLDPRPALDLFPEYEDSFQRVRSGLYTSNPSPVPWQDWLDMAAEARAIEPARALKRAEARLAASDATNPTKQSRQPLLAAVLNRLDAGQAHELAEHLAEALGIDDNQDTDPADPADPADLDRLIAALFSLVGQGLVEIGAARWHLSWTGASLLIPRDITADELVALLAAAVRDPLEVPRLRLHLAGLGLDEHAPIKLGEQNPQPGSLNVKPLTDPEALRRKRMAAAATVVLVGLIVVLAIVGSSSLPKRYSETTLFGPPTSQPSYDSYGAPAYSAPAYSAPAYVAPLPSFPAPRISLPSGFSSYLARPLMPISLPSDFTSTIVVRSGETLSSIAQACHTTVADLQRVNEMGSSTLINAGQTLKIPELFLPADCD